MALAFLFVLGLGRSERCLDYRASVERLGMNRRRSLRMRLVSYGWWVNSANPSSIES